jgi:ribose 1,5-bisphosphokinase
MPRYALYFAPQPENPWWQAGCRWLGRDPFSMRTLAQVWPSHLSGEQMHQLTVDARRYGFHATLKAPFYLADGCNIAQLDAALNSFCAGQSAFTLPAPQVQWMGNFLALRPDAQSPAIDALALRCVKHFSSFSAPLSAKEITRRHKPSLSPRQQELLQRWGYPYTEEEFRFHMTLSDAQKDVDSTTSTQLYDAAVVHFTIAEPLSVASIALFHEAAQGDDFQLLRHYRLGL